jgi:hypothetical protein
MMQASCSRSCIPRPYFIAPNSLCSIPFPVCKQWQDSLSRPDGFKCLPAIHDISLRELPTACYFPIKTNAIRVLPHSCHSPPNPLSCIKLECNLQQPLDNSHFISEHTLALATPKRTPMQIRGNAESPSREFSV